MSANWGQRLGNSVAIVTLLTAATAVYALKYRVAPVRSHAAAGRVASYCVGVAAVGGSGAPPRDPSPAIIARYETEGRTIVPFSRCGSSANGKVAAIGGSTLLLVDSAGDIAPLVRE